MQFFQIDKTNPPINNSVDFLTVKRTPETTANLIRNSCYDCHSNETKYPWYSYVQPGGWFLRSHVDEGRRKLNFSTFATLEPKHQAHKMFESWELVEGKEMPLESYTLAHKDAILTTEQRQMLVNYFKNTEAEIRASNNLPAEK